MKVFSKLIVAFLSVAAVLSCESTRLEERLNSLETRNLPVTGMRRLFVNSKTKRFGLRSMKRVITTNPFRWDMSYP